MYYKIIYKFDFFFRWVNFFYQTAESYPATLLILYFFTQKILRINSSCKWPVHFTSRVLYPQNCKIGRNSVPGMSRGCYIQARNGIKIGSNLRMGPNVGLISANHNPQDYDQHIESNPIIIGDNVWIGMNSVVMPGVKIGNNVIIGANSTVTKNIPDNSIAAGNPCKVIRQKEPYRGKNYSKL